jgi:hypothetical protein
MQKYIPVISSSNKALMPTTNYRANELIRKKKALRRFKAGIFYIKLVHRSDGATQDIVVGIDPGSKREAFTVKSEAHTYLNILSDSVTHVKRAIETRRNARRTRRYRTTPCRKNKTNRSKTILAPSTRARWQAKLRIAVILVKLFPITTFVVEDIKATTFKNAKRWNKSFSPLEVGKKYFYKELAKIAKVELRSGYDTYLLRQELNLAKTSSKLAEVFSAHNVDSWVLAHSLIGGDNIPDNKEITRLVPIQFHRRQLHRFNFSKGGIRKNYGGTLSLGLKRGSLVTHPQHGTCYLGGSSKNKLSVHSLETGIRLSQNVDKKDLIFLSYNYWRTTIPLAT